MKKRKEKTESPVSILLCFMSLSLDFEFGTRLISNIFCAQIDPRLYFRFAFIISLIQFELQGFELAEFKDLELHFRLYLLSEINALCL